MLELKKNYMKYIQNIKKLKIILFIMEMQLKDLNQLKKIILKVEYLLFLIQENKKNKIHIELNNKKLNKI